MIKSIWTFSIPLRILLNEYPFHLSLLFKMCMSLLIFEPCLFILIIGFPYSVASQNSLMSKIEAVFQMCMQHDFVQGLGNIFHFVSNSYSNHQ